MQISILGCGWLGLPLANKLIEKGHSVKGSTTSNEKISILQDKKIIPFLLELKPTEIIGDIDGLLSDSDLIIINIPPKLRSGFNESYKEKMITLIPYLHKNKIRDVVFISSTSVYEDSEIIIDENTKKNPETESGKQILEVESLLNTSAILNPLIIRFGGLINEERNPVKQLSMKTNLERPFAPVNLIHLNDCVHIISELIDQKCFNQEFNVVSSEHPTRLDYYTKKAKERNIEPPQFNLEDLRKGKIISNKKICTFLNIKEFTKL